MLIVSTFEKLATSLSFLCCAENRTFQYCEAEVALTSSNTVEELKEGEKGGEMCVENSELDEEEEEEGEEKTKESSERDSGSDIEIISDLKITDDTVRGTLGILI